MEEGVLLDLRAVGIKALRQKTISKLCCMLNGIKVLPAPNGLPRDWRGLAHLIGIETVSNGFSGVNPIDKLLHIWGKRDEAATFGKLQLYLQEIDRFDALDDTAQMIEEDAHFYYKMVNNPIIQKPLMLADDEKHVLTIDDVCRHRNGLNPQIYDAFVLFVDNDLSFATDLIRILETDYGLKLCVKERDLVGGLSFEHEAIMRLISERCNRLIVILSTEFLKSDAHKFFVNFAQGIGIEQGRRKVVPCLYKRCILPPELSSYFLLDYSRTNSLWNFWDKLRDSVVSVQISSYNEKPSITYLNESQFPNTIEEPKRLTEDGCWNSKSDCKMGNNNKSISNLISKFSPQRHFTQIFKLKKKKTKIAVKSSV